MTRRRGVARWLAISLAALALAGAAHAVEPDEILTDPGLEARARHISAGLRCLVCQNQSIDDSNAPLARDLRLLVRERLRAGDSDAQVMEFVENRYGEFVLLRPPIEMRTLLLWLGPLLVLLGAIIAGIRAIGRPAAPPAPLTSAEEQKLRTLMAQPEPEKRD